MTTTILRKRTNSALSDEKPIFEPRDAISTTAGISLYATRSLDIGRPDHHDFFSEVNLFQEIAKILANWP